MISYEVNDEGGTVRIHDDYFEPDKQAVINRASHVITGYYKRLSAENITESNNSSM